MTYIAQANFKAQKSLDKNNSGNAFQASKVWNESLLDTLFAFFFFFSTIQQQKDNIITNS